MEPGLWREVQEFRPDVMRETRAWVKGYITALEDVIKDLEPQRYGYLNDQDAERLADLIMKDVQTSLASAQETLDTINKIMGEGDGEAVQAPAHEAEAP
jgi:hypothetical protein